MDRPRSAHGLCGALPLRRLGSESVEVVDRGDVSRSEQVRKESCDDARVVECVVIRLFRHTEAFRDRAQGVGLLAAVLE